MNKQSINNELTYWIDDINHGIYRMRGSNRRLLGRLIEINKKYKGKWAVCDYI